MYGGGERGIGALPQTPVKKLFGKSFLTIFKNFNKNNGELSQ
jgi:hypothetical protein